MPMRKYHFTGPLDVPRFILILLALIVIALAGTAVLTVVSAVAFGVLLPILLWERLKQLAAWVRRGICRKEA